MNTTLNTFAVDGQSLRWHDAFAAATTAIFKNVPPSTDADQLALWALLSSERKLAATVLMPTPRFLLTDIVEATGLVTQGQATKLIMEMATSRSSLRCSAVLACCRS